MVDHIRPSYFSIIFPYSQHLSLEYAAAYMQFDVVLSNFSCIFIAFPSPWQFVGTDEAFLLDYAILEVQKVLSADINSEKEELYMSSLMCSAVWNGRPIKLHLVQAVFLSMSIWCDSKLQDYHLHFHQVPCHSFEYMS